jgi:MacB-like periplasmic core domain
MALFSAVSSDYFRVMHVPLLRGRPITEQDVETSPWVVVINAAMAQKYWPNEDPIGQLITVNTPAHPGEEKPREIVGVVGNVRQYALRTDPRPEMLSIANSASEPKTQRARSLQRRHGGRAILWMGHVTKLHANGSSDSVFGRRLQGSRMCWQTHGFDAARLLTNNRGGSDVDAECPHARLRCGLRIALCRRITDGHGGANCDGQTPDHLSGWNAPHIGSPLAKAPLK